MIKFMILIVSMFSFHAFGSQGLDNKQYLFKYEGDQHYKVHFTKSEVSWECVKGDELGRSETDKYQYAMIANDIYFIQWSELDGTFIALTINLKTNKIISTGISGHFKWFRKGDIVHLPL